MIKTALATLLCAGVLSVAAVPRSAPPVPQAPTTKISNYPVIVHVVSRDHTMTVSAGPKGPVYSLSDQKGKVMIADATGEEFEKLQPELYHHIRGTIAVHADASEAWADCASR